MDSQNQVFGQIAFPFFIFCDEIWKNCDLDKTNKFLKLLPPGNVIPFLFGESYLAEQFRQITHYLAEQFRQIAHYLAEHLNLKDHVLYQWSLVLVDSTILGHFKENFLAHCGMTFTHLSIVIKNI